MTGDGAGEDVDEDLHPLDERIDGDDDGNDFPSQRDVSLAEQLRRSPRLVLPRFRLETAGFVPIASF